MERQARAAEKDEQIRRVAQLERALTCFHREHFPAAERPVLAAPAEPDAGALNRHWERELDVAELSHQLGGGQHKPQAAWLPPVDDQAILREELKHHLADVGFLQPGKRRAAKASAREAAARRVQGQYQRLAGEQRAEQQRLDGLWGELRARRQQVRDHVEADLAPLRAQAAAQRAERQAALDADWKRLTGNDPSMVIAALERAFADNDAPATPIDCDGSAATVTVLYGHPDAVPDRKPALTAAGKPTLRKRTKTERNQLYLDALASSVLATVKEALAVCPGLDTVKVLVTRNDQLPDGGECLAAVYAASFARQHMDRLDWERLHPADELEAPADRQWNLRGRAGQVAPLDLRDEPELQAVLQQLAAVQGVAALTPKARAGRRANPASDPPAQPPATAPPRTLSPANASGWDATAGNADQRYDRLADLRERGDAALERVFRSAMSDPDASVRRQAAGALADLAQPDLRPLLVKLLADADPDVRREAICGLRDIPDPSIFDAVRTAADDPNQHVRRAAVGLLADLDSAAARPLLHECARDPDADLRYEALTGLNDDPVTGDAPVFLAALSDPDPFNRRTALSGLGALGDRQHTEAIAPLLDDTDPDVRYAAVGALDELGGPSAAAALRRALNDPEQDVRQAAQSALDAP